ncbi:MAG: adenylosuccinate lyase [Bacteroidetes bacterium]|nr:adenylosuccinate lyase [Bacteroidota bacterium]
MNLSTLDAISPVDGRYRKNCEPLAAYFSEASLIRYRVKIEAAYFLALCKIPLPQLKNVSTEAIKALEQLVKDPSTIDIKTIKDIEAVTNHDVKAVEYYLKQTYEVLLGHCSEFIHFGLTSQDINNTAIPLSIKDAMEKIMLPEITAARNKLIALSEEWRDLPMMARTHGQPASPTALGKEIAVFINRLDMQLQQLKNIPWSAKFGGATGNFNAHYAAYPEIDWVQFGNTFVESFGLHRSQITTQIDHYDNLAALFDNLKRINTILVDLCRDIWTYISMNYFTQEVKKGEVGSSAMPHKVNPIDFENAEGNFGFANAIFEHLSAKLPISRMQRDLTDSTVLRNTGVPFAHSLLALKSLTRGLNKIKVNRKTIEEDLENNWAVVAEAIQTVLRREGYPNPYEALKDLTRTGEKINKATMHEFIDRLNVNDAIKIELKKYSPSNYIGMALNFVIKD